jgi:hypothetical protein
VTFQTYEHELFVRAQRKLELWLLLLGSRTRHAPELPAGDVVPPPTIHVIEGDQILLDDLLPQISTVIPNISMDSLPMLEKPLGKVITYDNGQTNDEFLNMFPVKTETHEMRRQKRSRSRLFSIDSEAGLKVFQLFVQFGFDEWEEIAEAMDSYSVTQIIRFCAVITMLLCRCIGPLNLPYLPFLVGELLRLREPVIFYRDLLCVNSRHAFAIFNDDNDLSSEAEVCHIIKEIILSEPFITLSILEMRLISRCWSQFNNDDAALWAEIAPPLADTDSGLLYAIRNGESFDPMDLRVQAIVNQMRTDIIAAQLLDLPYRTTWWTAYEFQTLVSTLKNFPFDSEDPIGFHAKSQLVSKTSEAVAAFACGFIELIAPEDNVGATIPPELSLIGSAPAGIANLAELSRWTNLSIRTCNEIRKRLSFLPRLQAKIAELTPEDETEEWGTFPVKSFMDLVMKYGLDAMHDILIDPRFGFEKFLSETDLEFLQGKRSRRVLSESKLPDFLFTVADLKDWVLPEGERDHTMNSMERQSRVPRKRAPIPPMPKSDAPAQPKPKHKHKPKPKPRHHHSNATVRRSLGLSSYSSSDDDDDPDYVH